MKRIPLFVKIFIGIIGGVLFALLLIQFDWGKGFIQDWIKPFGTIFINLLKLIAVPLILASLIKGVSDLKDISKLSSMGFRTIGFYLFTTLIAVSLGLVVVNLVKPGTSISEETRTELLADYSSNASQTQAQATTQKSRGPLSFLEDIVPENIVNAASVNSNMLQVIFFALFLGIAMIMLPETKT